VTEILLKLLVKVSECVSPFLLAFFDLVQFLFKPSRVLNVKDIREVRYQQIGDYQANLRGYELPSQLLHVLPFLDGAEDGGIRGRSANSALFQFLDQRSFVVTRRRLGEMLFRIQALEN